MVLPCMAVSVVLGTSIAAVVSVRYAKGVSLYRYERARLVVVGLA